jgi:hypothetical protein
MTDDFVDADTGPRISELDIWPRAALRNDTRTYFYALGEDGKWINILVHPVDCKPVKRETKNS